MNAHQLNWMIKQIQIMSVSLGGNGVKQIDVLKDDFESARIQFQYHIKIYQHYKKELNQGKGDPLKQGELRHKIRDESIQIKNQMKYLIRALNLRHSHLKQLESKNKKKEEEIDKIKEELHYKQLVVSNCQRAYSLLFADENKQDWSGGVKAITMKELLKQHEAPLLDDSDSQGDQLIIDRIKAIDDYIQSQLDQIIDGINQMNRHARLISEALDQTHKKIVLNVKILDKNIKDLDNSNAKLKKYLKYCRQSYCLLDVILVLLLLVLAYIGYKQFYPS